MTPDVAIPAGDVTLMFTDIEGSTKSWDKSIPASCAAAIDSESNSSVTRSPMGDLQETRIVTPLTKRRHGGC